MPADRDYWSFILRSTFRAVVYFGLIAALFFLYQNLLPSDWKQILAPVADNGQLVFLIYTLSETFFGIIPPEFFVMWALTRPPLVFILIVAALAVLSFLAALVNFYVGTRLHSGRIYRWLISGRLRNYVDYYHRFGGIIILISALTPLPFAAISLISGTLGFPFRSYLVFASARFLRFLFYGLFFWEVQ